MPALAVDNTRAVARPPNVLVPLIKEAMAHANAARQQLCDLFAEARSGFDTLAEFLSWAHRHFGIRESQARDYVSIGKYRENNAGAAAPPSLSAALREMGRNRPTSGRVQREWAAPVDDIVDRARREAERIREAELTRQQERDAQRALALRLIDIGYKVLAKELHPDKGGSRDAMSRLHLVRDRLKAHA